MELRKIVCYIALGVHCTHLNSLLFTFFNISAKAVRTAINFVLLVNAPGDTNTVGKTLPRRGRR